jgi:hypothetical protein
VEKDEAWSENGSAKGALAAVSVGCETRVAAEPLSRATAKHHPASSRAIFHPAPPACSLPTRAHRPAKRIAVEHRLAANHNRQGDRARYRGLRKTLFDLRGYAALDNLNVVDQLRHAA